MSLVAVIPARGGSKGIPRKNIKLLDGKPLVFYSIDAAKKTSAIESVYVSTDDHEIASISEEYGASILWRGKELSDDSATAFSVIQSIYNDLEDIDSLVYLQPTSPLRNESHINLALKKFNDEECTSLVSVVEVPHNLIAEKQLEINDSILRPFIESDLHTQKRQDCKRRYARNGPAILITKRQTIENGDIYGSRVLPFIMDDKHSIDIDTDYDFVLAEAIKKDNDL